jgi:hypothetical protein
MYTDVNVNDIEETAAIKKKIDPTSDVKYFFSDPFALEDHKKKRRHCNICR